MNRYVILTNRKRAIVALAHSVAFLFVSLYGFFTVVRPLHRTSPSSAWAMFSIYLAVSAALLVLTALAGNLIERLYFGFCTSSAGFGFLRQVLGDPRMHAAVYIRVAALACAVGVGVLIVRGHQIARAACAARAGN